MAKAKEEDWTLSRNMQIISRSISARSGGSNFKGPPDRGNRLAGNIVTDRKEAVECEKYLQSENYEIIEIPSDRSWAKFIILPNNRSPPINAWHINQKP